MHSREEQLQALDRLLTIMDELRAQCPWDRKQTFESLRSLTLEEVYELCDSIDKKEHEELRKELGDVLMHLFFYAKIGSEQKLFDIKSIADGISEKLIHRHPHIYGDASVKNEAEVLENWEKLKLKEGRESVLEGVPTALPALLKAMRIQAKAKGVGFDWDNKEAVWRKFEEEVAEFKQEEKVDDRVRMEEEFGDMLFAMVNYARFIGIDPDRALTKTNAKFIYRFQYIEACAREQGKDISQLSVEEMEEFWQQAKQ